MISVGNSFLILDLYRTTLPSRAAILCRDDCLIDLQFTREWAVEQAQCGRDVTPQDFL